MRDRVTSRASKTFERAIFYKPRTGGWPGLEETFAPLIVLEVPQDDVIDRDSPGVVYAHADHAIIGDVRYERVSYYWRWGGANGQPGLPWQGVRITVGQDGFPLVWEVLNSGERVPMLYVSESAERAAMQAHGAPQPGARFAIELGSGDVSLPVDVDVLPDGPVPMGPYIYLASGSNEVTAVLCRCSPSQMNEIVESRWYELHPGDEADVSPGSKTRKPKPLDEQLRWPPGL